MRKGILFILSLLLFSGSIMSDTFGQRGRVRLSDVRDQSDHILDIAAEIQFGRDLSARILTNYPLVNKAGLNNYVNLVGRALTLFAGRPELNFYFGVINSDAVNAYATPGGYILITSAAVSSLENEAELAAMLGHEIAHVILRHVVKELDIEGKDGSALSGLAALIGGATGSYSKALEESLDLAHHILFKRGYRKEDELAADALGLTLMALSGYDPKAFIDVLNRMEAFEPIKEDDNASHPFTEVRVEKISHMLLSFSLDGKNYFKGERRFDEYTEK